MKKKLRKLKKVEETNRIGLTYLSWQINNYYAYFGIASWLRDKEITLKNKQK